MGIYLDYAATAPVRPEVRRLVDQGLSRGLGNPSSLHRLGRQARMVLEQAREDCARQLEAKVEEIIFTSGATESNALALWGTMRLGPDGGHLLYSAVEHPAVAEYAASLMAFGYEVETVPVNRQGVIDLGELRTRIRPNTVLVSVMAANNEVGALQPIESVAELCREAGVLLHVDCVQSPLTAACGADLMSLSGHKLGGLPAGCLYLRQGLRLAPMLIGGAQEDSRRAGTPNVLGAASLAAALECHQDDGERERVKSLRDYLEEQLTEVEGSHLIAREAPRAAHVSAWLFEGLTAEPLLARLDLDGVAASSGSACSSHSVEPSKVLLSMGYSDLQAAGLIRFSLGWASERSDVERAVLSVVRAVEQIRQAQKGKVA